MNCDPSYADLVSVEDQSCRSQLEWHITMRHAIRPSPAEAATPLESLGFRRLLHQVCARAKIPRLFTDRHPAQELAGPGQVGGRHAPQRSRPAGAPDVIRRRPPGGPGRGRRRGGPRGVGKELARVARETTAHAVPAQAPVPATMPAKARPWFETGETKPDPKLDFGLFRLRCRGRRPRPSAA